MDYHKIQIKDFFYIKKIESKAESIGNAIMGDERENAASSVYVMNNVGITITCAKQLGICYCDGNNFAIEKPCYLLASVSNDNVNVKYVYYFLLSNKDRLDKLYISLKESAFIRALSRLVIFYPSVSEQQAIVGKLDVIFNLVRVCEDSLRMVEKLPYAVYRRNERIAGSLWKTVQIGDITQRISIKKGENQISEKIKKSTNSLIFGNKTKLVLDGVSPEYDVEFLKCILSGKQFVSRLEQAKRGKISLYKIKQTIVRIPSKKEQDLILLIYHKSNEVKDYLYDSVCSLYVLKEYCLYRYLFRKNFGQHIHEFLRGDLLKYSYLKPMMIGSLNRYDELRKELYDSLRNHEVIQDFDEVTKSVKLRRK